MVKTKKDWICFAEWYGLYWFHSPYIHGWYSELKKNIGYTFPHQVWEYRDGVQRFYVLKSEWNEVTQKYFKEVRENPELLAQALKKIIKAAQNLFTFNEKIKKIDFQKVPWNKIVSTFSRFHQLHYNVWCLGMVPNLLELENTLLSSYLLNYLDSKRKAGYPAAQKLFLKLTTPLNWSFNQREEYDFLNLLVKYQRHRELAKKVKSIKDLEGAQKVLQKDFKECWQDLIRHHQMYHWLPYTWTGPAWEINYFVDVFRLRLKEKDLAQKSASMKEELERLESVKKDWFDKLAIDDYHQKLFALMTGIIWAKAFRMDALFQSYCFIEPLLKRAAKEFNISLKQIYIIYDEDLIEIFKKKKFPVALANQMLKHSVYRAENGKFKLYTGKKALAIMKPILKVLPKPKEVNEIQGDCGCPGHARGIVKVIAVPEEMSKMGQGDIMVSQVTNPSLVPAMKKASAIITDAGGLTCHAAIVSREMNTPCVIGTKIATKVLKDGDRVEVDATKGVVRKLNK